MSLKNAQEFIKKVSSDSGLLEQFLKIPESGIYEGCLKLADDMGFAFSCEEMNQVLHGDGELDDASLASVCGGAVNTDVIRKLLKAFK